MLLLRINDVPSSLPTICYVCGCLWDGRSDCEDLRADCVRWVVRRRRNLSNAAVMTSRITITGE